MKLQEPPAPMAPAPNAPRKEPANAQPSATTFSKSYTNMTYNAKGSLERRNDNYYTYDETNQLLTENWSNALPEEQNPILAQVEDDWKETRSYQSNDIVVSGTLYFDYAAGSIVADFGEELPVTEVTLTPQNTTHRVTATQITLSLSTDNNTYNPISQTGYTINGPDGSGEITIIFDTDLITRYLKVHCTFDDRDIDFKANNESQFYNDIANLITIKARTNSAFEAYYQYDAAGNRIQNDTEENGQARVLKAVVQPAFLTKNRSEAP